MPNALAYAMLLLWPAIAFVLLRSLPFERGLVWSILGAYLLLPPVANFDFPLVPPLDKHSIPNLAAFVIVVAVLGRGVPVFRGSPLVRVLLILFVASPIATTALNSDPLVVGPVVIQGLPPTDAIAEVVKQAIILLPFFLARRFLATEAAQREILLALAIAGLAYSVPMLLEVRLSPQLNIWIYGFFPHAFDQQIRFGGFRPVVFLGHGLWVALFTCLTVFAAFGLWRATAGPERGRFLLWGGYLSVVLVLCKSVGALVYALVLVPVIVLVGRRGQIRIAALLAAIVVLYPLLRGAGLIPVETMIAQAEAIDPGRAESLGFRLRNESDALAHAAQRPVFGWGGFGRNLPRNPFTGRSGAVLDGHWIITISIFGWCGYLVEFGLLAAPLLLLARRTRGTPAEAISPHAGPLALILAANMFDLLPNATITPVTFLVAGALLGHAEAPSRAGDAATGREGPARARAERIETVL